MSNTTLFLMGTKSYTFRPRRVAVFIYKLYMLRLTDCELIFYLSIGNTTGKNYLKKNP